MSFLILRTKTTIMLYFSLLLTVVIESINCRDIMMDYSKKIRRLGNFLFELLSEALGLNPNHLKEMKCTEGLVLGCHYYPPCPQPELALGIAGHTDKAFVTVLLQDQIGGLQILHENKWIDIPPVPGAF